MSYSKLNLEIERYLKQNDLPFIGKSTDSKEETEKRLEAYKKGRDVIFKKWIEEKRFKELISCAHGRWFPYDEFTKPLADYFITKNNLLELKVLCEKEIRFKIEDTLKCLKNVKESFPKATIDEMISYDLEEYLNTKSYHPIGELSKWRAKALLLLERYIELLKQTKDNDYLKTIEELYEKSQKLIIKKSDLKCIKHKLK